MEQEFNDQKHVTSLIVCVHVCLPPVCEPQATQQIYTRKSIGAISTRNYAHDGTINVFMSVIFVYNTIIKCIACQEYFH